MRETGSNTVFIALAIIFVFTALTMVVVQSPLTSNMLRQSGLITLDNATPVAVPTPSPAIQPLVDTDTTTQLTLRNSALGFSLEYPAGWHKRESTLDVVISPSSEGLNPLQPEESVLWIGIPANDDAGPVELLQNLVEKFVPISVESGTTRISNLTWNTAQVDFAAPELGGQGRALIATTSNNRVGYFLVTIAPAAQWQAVRPTFNQIIDSFEFTQQAVLRPTDATPPPTPTPTPTPVIYVVQSGDTLSGIAGRYGIDMEAIMNRNGLIDPGRLRTGQELIIPVRR